MSFKALWAQQKSLGVFSAGFGFLFEDCFRGAAKLRWQPTQAYNGHYMLPFCYNTIQSFLVSSIVLACPTLPLFCLAKWCGDGVSSDSLRSSQDCFWTCRKTHLDPLHGEPLFFLKAHPVWLHICGEPKPFSVSFSNMLPENVLLLNAIDFVMLWFCF